MVAPYNFVGRAKRGEEFGGQLVACGGACEELLGFGRAHRLGFPEVAEAHDAGPDAPLHGVREDGLEVGPPSGVVLHRPRVQMEITEDGHHELIFSRQLAHVLFLVGCAQLLGIVVRGLEYFWSSPGLKIAR